MLHLLDLNLDCILHICAYLSEKDRENLGLTNRTLRCIIDEYFFMPQSLDLLMTGHRNKPRIQQRTRLHLSYAKRLWISRNWMEGRYKEYVYYRRKKMLPTKLHLDPDYVYITYERYLRKYGRLDREPLAHRYERELASSYRSDIVNFVKKQNTLFAVHACGNSFIYEDNHICNEQRLHPSKEEMYSLDFARDMYASGSKVSCKLWRRANELGRTHLDLMYSLQRGYKVVHFNESGTRLYGGLYTDLGRQALNEIDLETGKYQSLNSKSLSIYDLKLKDDNVIFTANFDTCFRMYDRRSDSDEAVWEDPFDSSYYCLEYDGLYGVLCGAKYHGRVNLYDIRVPGKYQQLYFPFNTQNSSSPVYSLACDSQYLFVAMDHSLRVFDFTFEFSKSRSYRDYFKQMHRI